MTACSSRRRAASSRNRSPTAPPSSGCAGSSAAPTPAGRRTATPSRARNPRGLSGAPAQSKAAHAASYLSLHLNVRFPDQLAEALEVRLVHRGELLARQRARLAAQAGEPLVHVGQVHDLHRLV